MKIIITGASGFIGTNLLQFYIDKGVDVINIDICQPRKNSHMKYWKKLDILNKVLLESVVLAYEPDYVIHLAARTDLNGKEITIDDLILGIRRACQSLKVFPVLCGAAFKNKGVQMLLDSVVKYLPSPLDVPSVKAVKKGKEEETFDVVSNKDQSFIGLAFKISMDPFFGQLAYLRIYSGKVKVGQTILNVNKGKKEKVSRLVMVHSNHKSDIKIA